MNNQIKSINHTQIRQPDSPPPLSLYIHIPWCIKKCPYCDFNSHANNQADIRSQEDAYIDQLITDFTAHLPEIADRPLHSLFIGGGTPSLFSPNAYARLLSEIDKHCPLSHAIEITLEANPGTIDHRHFAGYRHAGINRLSLGVQSFCDTALQRLGRIHDATTAEKAIALAQKVGFNRINIDIMYGLPEQSIKAALSDLQKALSWDVTHLSWYQLTIEPNTLFYRYQPTLPKEQTLIDMETAGLTQLSDAGFTRYEISAYCRDNHVCQHNLNYWQYGDYLGLGAGAHSKLTDLATGTITRFWKTKQPANYLNPDKPFIAQKNTLSHQEKPLEFMLNALRLFSPTAFTQYEAQTGLPREQIMPTLDKAVQLGWLTYDKETFCPTSKGYCYLNDLVALFLPN